MHAGSAREHHHEQCHAGYGLYDARSDASGESDGRSWHCADSNRHTTMIGSGNITTAGAKLAMHKSIDAYGGGCPEIEQCSYECCFKSMVMFACQRYDTKCTATIGLGRRSKQRRLRLEPHSSHLPPDRPRPAPLRLRTLAKYQTTWTARGAFEVVCSRGVRGIPGRPLTTWTTQGLPPPRWTRAAAATCRGQPALSLANTPTERCAHPRLLVQAPLQHSDECRLLGWNRVERQALAGTGWSFTVFTRSPNHASSVSPANSGHEAPL